MTLILAYKNRGQSLDLVIRDVNEDPITPGVNDRVRVTIGYEGETPLLTVVDNAPTAGGSTLTKGETNVLRLDASDLDFDAGIYTLFFNLLDAADSSEWKTISREVFSLQE